MDFSIGNSWYLLLLLLLPIMAFLLFGFKKWRRKKQNIFADSKFQHDLFTKQSFFSKIFPIIYLLAILFLVLAMVDLLSGKQDMKVKQNVNNVLFVIDVSNSMNAEDVEPSRLLQAKYILINSLQKMKNDRVGIIVFAGEAQSIMPITSDYEAVETYIAGIETQIIEKQGTDFLKAMQLASEKLKNVASENKKIILISDGEDNEGNDEAALKEAKKTGISVISVGLGTEEGAPIPEFENGQFMGYKVSANDDTVITKRQTEALKNLAEETNGEYIDGNNLEVAISKILNHMNLQNSASEVMVKSTTYVHHYQWFLAISLLLFLVMYFFNPKRDLNF